jgi:hypothetical protein
MFYENDAVILYDANSNEIRKTTITELEYIDENLNYYDEYREGLAILAFLHNTHWSEIKEGYFIAKPKNAYMNTPVIPPPSMYSNQNTTETPTEGEIYDLPYGKSMDGLINAVNNFLSQSKNMETQKFTNNGVTAVQARNKGGGWKQFLGMDKALTVQISSADAGKVRVNIGQTKWGDKLAVMGVSMFVLWPLLITSGIGMIGQAMLPEEIKGVIKNYLSN